MGDRFYTEQRKHMSSYQKQKLKSQGQGRKDGKPSSMHQQPVVEVSSLDEFIAISEANSKTPAMEWLYKTFKTKSAIIRYLHAELGMDVKSIAQYTSYPYRHVYGVVNKKLGAGSSHICPVCRK